MRKKKVWRYYCDFCKKANCSGAAMSKHEKHCTLNPDRICRMCALVDLPQPDLRKVMSILPDPQKYEKTEINDGVETVFFTSELDKAVAKALPELRDELENCPACIMAALRLKGIPVPVAKDFNYRDENVSWWQDYNDNQQRINEESTYY